MPYSLTHRSMSLKRLLFLLSVITVFCLGANAVNAPAYKYIPRIVKIHDDSELDSLAEDGVEIMRRRGDILLCLFPNHQTRSKDLIFFNQRRIVPTLDIAKEYYDASSIQLGAVGSTPYTGKGVVVGICDLGIDPMHPTFLDHNGQSRIKRIVEYKELDGKRMVLEGEDAYNEWLTDSIDEFHATHVCGILAGGGGDTPYSGIASGADIVVTTSMLTDVGLLAGVEDIIDYAKEVGKRAVINISVGSYIGPHDGSSLFSQYLDMCADDAVIVMSAGNEGHRTNTLMAEFAETQQSVSFRLGSKDWLQFKMTGATDIWSGSSDPLTLSLKVFDDDIKSTVLDLGTFIMVDGNRVILEWNEDSYSSEGIPFIGALMMEGEVNSENGRYHVLLSYDYESPIIADKGQWAKYDLALEVKGSIGNDIEAYSDGSHTRLVAMSGNPRPTSERTVSDLACGDRVISVGMYGNRSVVPLTDMSVSGGSYQDSTGYEPGATVRYSSYGTLRDGRMLPVTVAPGATLMSSASRPFLDRHSDYPHLMLDSPWISEAGTSMSSPYVAGYIATWLEAVPDLAVEEIMEIIMSTNRQDIPEPEDPHNANGYFDPLAGLRMALRMGEVESVDDPCAILLPDDFVSIYDMTGIKIYAGAASGLSGIKSGLYVVHTPYGVMKKYFPLE